MESNDFKDAISDFEKYESLPIAVYVTALNGDFILSNEMAKKFFNLSKFKKSNIEDFYVEVHEREEILSRLKSKKKGEWEENKLMHLMINNEKRSFRYFSKPYFDTANNYIGALCMLISIKEFERYTDLDELMPIGIFITDKKGRLISMNDQFKALFGIPPNTTTTYNAFDFINESDKFTQIRKELVLNKYIQNKDVEFRRINGTLFTGKLNIISNVLNNKIVESKGTIEDITFREILDEAPIGLYKVVINSEKEILQSANVHFAKIFGYDSPQDCEGKPIVEFHKDNDSFIKFKQELIKANRSSSILSNHPLEVLTKDGIIKETLVSAKILISKNGLVKGRIGLIYDVTNDLPLRMTEWDKDFAAFTHMFSSRIGMIQNTLHSIMSAHNSDLVKTEGLDIEKTYNVMYSHINSFRKSFNRYLDEAYSKSYLDKTIVEKILFRLQFIDNTNEISPITFDNVRAYFHQIRIEFEKFNHDLIKNDVVRPIRNDISEVLRYARLLSINDLISYIDEVFIDIDTFQSALIHRHFQSVYTNFNISLLLQQAKRSLIKYADSKKLEIRIKADLKIILKGDERLLYNVFYNIFHNAVKYSWTKADSKESWIRVEIVEKSNTVEITCENRGVAIKQDEINTEEIFRFGRRGTNSSDKNRPGSGIGLWYCKKIVDDHKGKLEIFSNPLQYNSKEDYSKPFIIVVKITLPKT